MGASPCREGVEVSKTLLENIQLLGQIRPLGDSRTGLRAQLLNLFLRKVPHYTGRKSALRISYNVNNLFA